MASEQPFQPLAEAVRSSDGRVVLEGLRDALVADIGDCPPDKRAALYARLQDVLDRLQKLPAKEASGVDDLAARRAVRRANAAVQKRSTRGVKRGAGGD